MLSEVDVRLLAALDAPTSIGELSQQTGYSSGYVSERVARLTELDLIATTDRNRTKTVRALETPVREALRELRTSHPHTEYASLVSPSMLRICWFLDRPTAVHEMESRLMLGRRRIYQLLEELQSRGLIVTQNDHYRLTERQQGLARFAQAVIAHEHTQRVRSLLPAAAVIWSGPREALASTNTVAEDDLRAVIDAEDRWQTTGLDRFSEWGLAFFSAGSAPIWYSALESTLEPADIIAHTLIDQLDTRTLSYSVLLVHAAAVSPEELGASAGYYGLEETIDALIAFVETRGDERMAALPLPSWDEIESLAAQYGVDL